MNRHSLPRWANRLIDRIADSPTSLVGRLAAKRLGAPAPTGSVPATSFANRPTRLLIAPVNYSGQGRAWAAAIEAADPSVSARNMAFDVPGGFSFEADLVVPVGTYHNDPDWQLRQLDAAASATHVLVEAEEPPFGRLLGRSVEAQVEALRSRGVSVAYLGHGVDVRLPSRHMAANEWSYFHDPSVYWPRAETLATRNIELLRSSGLPLFVSTPDLLIDLPEAVWCPVAVDPERWDAPREPSRADGNGDGGAGTAGHPLRVVHAPSIAAVKGTSLVVPVLEKLHEEGVVEFSLIRGVPSAQMPARLSEADVVLDQFRLGAYGVVACEAMAAGCVVVGHVSEQARDAVRAASGLDLPIVEATPDTVEQVVRALAAEHAAHVAGHTAGHTDDRATFAERIAAGKRFVRELHDGRAAARALLDHWIKPRDRQTNDSRTTVRQTDDRNLPQHEPAGDHPAIRPAQHSIQPTDHEETDGAPGS